MFQNLINLFFPKSCAACTSFLLAEEFVVCTGCRHKLPLTNHHLLPDNETIKKFYGRIPIAFGASLFYFHKKGIVQQLIHNLKYKGQEEIGTTIGQWYAEDLKNIESLVSIDEIIPVPLHRRKLKERGYNQVTAFGKALSSRLDIHYNDSLLIRNVYSKTQSKKNLLGRTEGIETVFDVSFTEKDHNKHFLIIDDVITTGSTLEACSKVMMAQS